MAIKKEKFFEIINEVSKSEGLNENNLLERIESELKGVNSGVYDTYNKLKIGNTSDTFSTFNKLKINKLFVIQDSDKTVNYTLLHLAVECNSIPIVKLLLAKEVEVNESIHELGEAKSKLTALHIAALHGHEEIVQLLLNNNANPLLKDSQDRTPRDIVGNVEGKKAIIKMLEEGKQRYVEARATRRQTYRQGTTPNNRKIYVQDEDEQTSSNSITNENNINKVDDTLEGEQAIRERDAMLQKLQEAEQRLANNQKRIEHDDLHNQHTEQQYTIYNGEQTSSDLATDESSNDSGICFDADEALGQSISENGEDINAQDENGLTTLHHAAANGDVKTAKYLIDNGANVNARNRDGYTPLHYAAAYGCVEIAEYLVVNEANVNAQDKAEYTPLCYALANDKKELVKLLIKHGADRSLIKDEDLIDRLNKLPEVVSSTSYHSKTHNATEAQEEAEKVKKLKVKLKKSRAQLEDKQKENESLRQEIKNLKDENTTLKGELGKTKTKTNKLSLEKVGKRQFSPKVACASLAAMLVVGAALSIASGLSALLIVAASVVSALIAGGVTYTMSTKPDTELKEVDIQGSVQHGICKT